MSYEITQENNNEFNTNLSNKTIVNELFETFLDKLKQELDEGLKRHELNHPNKISEEITYVEEQIKKYEAKKQTRKLNECKEILKDLEKLQGIYENIQKIESNSSNNGFGDLETQLREGLLKHEISDPKQLKEEIKERLDEIEKLERKSQPRKAAQRRKSLEELEEFQAIFIKLQSLSDIQNDDLRALQDKLKEGLTRHELTDPTQLEEEINDLKNEIEKLLKKSQFEKAERLRKILEDLVNLQKIYRKIGSSKTTL